MSDLTRQSRENDSKNTREVIILQWPWHKRNEFDARIIYVLIGKEIQTCLQNERTKKVLP